MNDSFVGTVNKNRFGNNPPETLLFTVDEKSNVVLRLNRAGWNKVWNGTELARVEPIIYQSAEWPFIESYVVRRAKIECKRLLSSAAKSRNSIATISRRKKLTLAQQKLAAAHIWIAQYHSKRLAGEIGYWDMLGIAYIALVHAARKWPGEKSFVPYATTRIVQRLINAIRDSNRMVRKGILSFCEYKNFEPDDQNFEDDETSVYYVRDWIVQLPADEQQAIRLAYGIGTRKRTTVEIAKRLKLPQHVASEVIRSGLLRLRYMATCEQVNG